MEGFIPWPDEFAREYREKGYWLDKTISEVMDECFERYATRTALIADDGRIFTYSELGRLSTRLALHLNALGLKTYDRLLLQIPNVPEVLITYLATLKAGGIPIMALSAYRDSEIGYFAKLAKARAMAVTSTIRDFNYQEMAGRILGEKACVFVVLLKGKEMPLESLNGFLINEQKIARFKLPERLELVDSLPLTPVGKINKKELRRVIAERLEKEGG
ncbi:MAG: AMP-binding protein [Deltaproteobacteria bacterium]|nr:AMP-binding protein [Deltaproteobacteria bacterium]